MLKMQVLIQKTGLLWPVFLLGSALAILFDEEL